jgi:4a-hydroxytetrahydrobiopterin dehydratase
MQIIPIDQLVSKKCVPCEGGVDACPIDFVRQQLALFPLWSLSDDGKWIRRKIQFHNFLEGVDCIDQIAVLAESEAHHPDLHLTGYRNLEIAISTHAIDGLSENDFILASKIDALIAHDFPNAKVAKSGAQS